MEVRGASASKSSLDRRAAVEAVRLECAGRLCGILWGSFDAVKNIGRLVSGL
jgi:hypothetical protein